MLAIPRRPHRVLHLFIARPVCGFSFAGSHLGIEHCIPRSVMKAYPLPHFTGIYMWCLDRGRFVPTTASCIIPTLLSREYRRCWWRWLLGCTQGAFRIRYPSVPLKWDLERRNISKKSWQEITNIHINQESKAWVRERTIPTERSPIVVEDSVNFFG
jgi:hypothetical protein